MFKGKRTPNGRQMNGGAPPGEYIAHPVTCDQLDFAW